MQDLYLKPSQDRTSVILYPANIIVFKRVEKVWTITTDSSIPLDVLMILLSSFHKIRNNQSYTCDVIADYLNTILTGKRLVIDNTCIMRLVKSNEQKELKTRRVVPVIHNGDTNVIGIDSLLNSAGLLPEKAGKLTAHYDGMTLQGDIVRVFLDGLQYCTIECKVK